MSHLKGIRKIKLVVLPSLIMAIILGMSKSQGNEKTSDLSQDLQKITNEIQALNTLIRNYSNPDYIFEYGPTYYSQKFYNRVITTSETLQAIRRRSLINIDNMSAYQNVAREFSYTLLMAKDCIQRKDTYMFGLRSIQVSLLNTSDTIRFVDFSVLNQDEILKLLNEYEKQYESDPFFKEHRKSGRRYGSPILLYDIDRIREKINDGEMGAIGLKAAMMLAQSADNRISFELVNGVKNIWQLQALSLFLETMSVNITSVSELATQKKYAPGIHAANTPALLLAYERALNSEFTNLSGHDTPTDKILQLLGNNENALKFFEVLAEMQPLLVQLGLHLNHPELLKLLQNVNPFQLKALNQLAKLQNHLLPKDIEVTKTYGQNNPPPLLEKIIGYDKLVFGDHRITLTHHLPSPQNLRRVYDFVSAIGNVNGEIELQSYLQQLDLYLISIGENLKTSTFNPQIQSLTTKACAILFK
ncbi:MAG: hypothetical protein SGJ18_05335 [Pseudomonadota bacterium]|nr:hypothetical protein [Pseudomonadota bacterium]